MIRGLAAPIRLKDSHAARSQYFIGRDDSVLRRASTESQGVRMLEQKQRIRLRARQNGRFGLLLQIERGGVIDAAQSLDFESSMSHQLRIEIVAASACQKPARKQGRGLVP